MLKQRSLNDFYLDDAQGSGSAGGVWRVAARSCSSGGRKSIPSFVEEEPEEEVVREMERRADQFYETGLVGRCFDTWAQANDWVQVSWCEAVVHAGQ